MVSRRDLKQDRSIMQYLSIIMLVLGIVAYSLIGFAYVNEKFMSKDEGDRRIKGMRSQHFRDVDKIDNSLYNISNKIDTILEKL